MCAFPCRLQGVVVQFRVMDGELRKSDLVKFMNTGCEYDITELGVLSPKAVEVGGGCGGHDVHAPHVARAACPLVGGTREAGWLAGCSMRPAREVLLIP
jgi:hypothetical protein